MEEGNSLVQILVGEISFLPGGEWGIIYQRADVVQGDVDLLDHDASDTTNEGEEGGGRGRVGKDVEVDRAARRKRQTGVKRKPSLAGGGAGKKKKRDSCCDLNTEKEKGERRRQKIIVIISRALPRRPRLTTTLPLPALVPQLPGTKLGMDPG